MTRLNINQHGVTLIEVLIALAITGVVTLAVMKLYLNQHEVYLIQDDVTTVQMNARASIDELTRQIRMAGNRLPAGLAPIVAANTNPDTITIAYRNNHCDTYLSAKMPQPSAELKCATDVSCFYDGQWVYIFDPDSGGGEFFEITHVQTGSKHLQHNTMTLSKAYDANAQVLSIEQMKFYVDTTTDPDHPRLMMQPVGRPATIYADNISDLQFEYRLTNGMVVDEPLLVEDVLDITITVTGRSDLPDVDHPDRYRERTYSSSVNLRNVGI